MPKKPTRREQQIADLADEVHRHYGSGSAVRTAIRRARKTWEAELRSERVVALSLPQVAQMLGSNDPDNIRKYKLPEPDVTIGPVDGNRSAGQTRHGWFPETIKAWDAARPGRGRWGARTEPKP